MNEQHTYPRRITEQITVSMAQSGLPEDIGLSVKFVLPEPSIIPEWPAVFFCFPGGSFSKEYFDLDPGGRDGLSFAESMANRGFISALVDHPGVGESDRPEDGMLLDPDTVAKIDCAAVNAAKDRLALGFAEQAGFPAIRSIGLGHSMGGMLTALMQAHHAPFDAIGILGSNPFGAMSILMEALQPLADDPVRTRSTLVSLLRQNGAPGYKDMIATPGPTDIFEQGDEPGRAAVTQARSLLLTVCGMFSMIPGSWKPEAAQIDVPVYLAFGDGDLCTAPYDVPSRFTASPEIAISILKGTGHNHFAFASRNYLYDRIARWAQDLP